MTLVAVAVAGDVHVAVDPVTVNRLMLLLGPVTCMHCTGLEVASTYNTFFPLFSAKSFLTFLGPNPKSADKRFFSVPNYKLRKRSGLESETLIYMLDVRGIVLS